MQNERCERHEDWAKVIVRLKRLFNQFPAKLLRSQAHRCSKCRKKLLREVEEKTPRRRRVSSSSHSVFASVASSRTKRYFKSLSTSATPASTAEQQSLAPPVALPPPLPEAGESAADGGGGGLPSSETPLSSGRRSRSARAHARRGADFGGTVRECKHIPKAYFSTAADGNILETLNLSISRTHRATNNNVLCARAFSFLCFLFILTYV